MDQLVWRALGDPNRRRILDLLRHAPRTTGELAEAFETSRYAVMKHLRVLERSRLITVRREGRHRWNHLNTVPLREIYERWLGPYQELWATNLLGLRRHVADPARSPPRQEDDMGSFNRFAIAQEITVDAPPEKVWAALTSDIGQWWSFRVGDAGSTIALDPRLGGRFEERWGDGEGVIWGEVVDLRRGKRLRLQGNLGMSGPGVNDYSYELEGKGDQTVLKLTHHAFGYLDAKTEGMYRQGWEDLFGKYLTAWLHDGRTAAELDADA